MGEWKLKAKDLDSYTSFLGRLNKLGCDYIIRNDTIYPMVLGTKSGSTDKIPGIHFVQDPFNEGYGDPFDNDYLYKMAPIEIIYKTLKDIKGNNPSARKDIRVIKDEDGMVIKMTGCNPITVAYRMPDDSVSASCKGFIPRNFGDLEVTDYEWDSLLETEMVGLRDNGLVMISQKHNDVKMWSRIAKSVFPMAGTTKAGTPIAKEIKFTFMEPNESQKDVATLRFLVTYKTPGGSSLINIKCIHQYRVFVY